MLEDGMPPCIRDPLAEGRLISYEDDEAVV